jgi:hypothetical protein
MAFHDGPRFKPMPDHAWLHSGGLHALAVAGSRRACRGGGEHRREAAGEGQGGKGPCCGSSREGKHRLTPSKRDGTPGIRRARSRSPPRLLAALRLTSKIMNGSVLFRDAQIRACFDVIESHSVVMSARTADSDHIDPFRRHCRA